MKLDELLDGSPAGCIGAADLLSDQWGMLWVRGDAEVFEPFMRLETSRNKEAGGVGLGLSVTSCVRAGCADVIASNRAQRDCEQKLFCRSKGKLVPNPLAC